MSLRLAFQRILNFKPLKKGSKDKKTKPSYSTSFSTVTTTTSLSNDIKVTSKSSSEHKFEAGRRFHGDEGVQYFLPNDEQESDRIHQQHWMLRYAFQGNYEAPIHDALNKGLVVLDAGCGPGTWTLEMAETYPLSQFHGIDVSAVFPERIKPGNCHFSIANLTHMLPFPDNHFDYIHQRLLVAGLSEADYGKALTELLRVLKPGGWLEVKEIELEMANPGRICTLFNKTLAAVMSMKGLNPRIAITIKDMFEERGLKNVNEKVLIIPINHGGKLGDLFWDDMKDTLGAFKPAFAKLYPEKYSDESAFLELVEECGEECRERKIGGNWYAIIGQKP